MSIPRLEVTICTMDKANKEGLYHRKFRLKGHSKDLRGQKKNHYRYRNHSPFLHIQIEFHFWQWREIKQRPILISECQRLFSYLHVQMKLHAHMNVCAINYIFYMHGCLLAHSHIVRTLMQLSAQIVIMKFDVMRHVIELCLSDFQSRARLLIIHFFVRSPIPATPSNLSRTTHLEPPHLVPSFRSQSLLKRLSVCVCMYVIQCTQQSHRARSLASPFWCVCLLLSHCFFLALPKTHHIDDIVCGWGQLNTCVLACIVRTYFIICH